jgi:hypothetical protein
MPGSASGAGRGGRAGRGGEGIGPVYQIGPTGGR